MISDNLKKTKDAMQQLETRMAAEKARLAEFSQSKQDELSQRLQQATLDVQNAEEDLKQAEALVRDKKNEASGLHTQGEETDREIQVARNSVMGLREQIQRCVEQQNNSLALYGRNLKNVVERIRQMRWNGQKPLGPLGVYVKLKDHVWADLLRTVLGNNMSSFAVTDGRDVPALRKLLRESGKCVDCFLFLPSDADDDIVRISTYLYPRLIFSITSRGSLRLNSIQFFA